LVVSAIALVIIFTVVKPAQLLQAMRLADFRLVLLGGLLSLCWVIIRTFLWRTLLQEKATFGQVFTTLSEGYLLNNFLPFRLGEVARAFLLSRKARLEFWQVFSSIIIERALDMAMAASLFLITLTFVVSARSSVRLAILVGAIVALGLGTLYWLARNQEWALSLFERLSARWPFLNKLGGRILPSFLAGLGVLTDGSHFLRAILWELANWGVAFLQYYLVLQAFFPGARPLWAAFCMGSAALGIAAPSSPGAVGVYEGVVMGALAVFGLDPSKALAYAITLHFWNYLIYGLLGAYSLGKDGESLSSIYRQARQIKEKS
jgi:glycosyltransferase 2 family protein